MEDRLDKLIRIIAVIMFVWIIVMLYQRYSHIINKNSFLQQVEQYKDMNIFFVLYIIIGTLLSCLFVPMSWVKAGAALTMGIGRGFVAALLIGNLFSVLSFVIGRLLSKKFLYKWFDRQKEKKNINYEDYMKNIEENGFYYVLYMRNIPIVTAAMVNYLCAMTTISFKKYFWGSFIGMIPGTLLNVYLVSNVFYWKDNVFNTIILAALIMIYYYALHRYTKKHISFQVK
ncbi:putative membrane protein YdjX (TVP38/TMEM64 family) [Natranaerovirga pectinivora]|uniref:TVP38/TMEM64 family membrane protein n=1 Tax=Natranaerovirga pectinivora TaxID=682400 RepID=A0A4R3MMK0_9FIRM|nr:VTT domain-containing protein [Natranaerovirga pectinivora]TCT15485.1 putative membrane protein YdjX (TVP38/TMEM64 family) [Natranaerovirga pectinivora]